MSFQSVQGGVGYTDTTSDADSRRRQMMAKLMLDQGNATPAVGVTGALNRILSGALAGYNIGKDSEEQTARADARNDTLARALHAGQGQAAETKSYGDGTTINWDERKGDPALMASILASNRDTAPTGMQMQVSQMDTAAKSQADLAKELRTHKNAIELERNKKIAIPGNGGGVFVPDAPGAVPSPMQAPTAQVATAPPISLATASGSGPMGPQSNNPGNIRTSADNAWQGKNTPQGAQFEAFDTPENGIRAMGVLLGNYAKQGVNTLGGIVSKWAPPNENKTDALITNAAKRTGLDPNQPLDLSDPAVRAKVVQALIIQEQGKMPYGQDVVQSGVDASLNRTAQPPAAPPRVQVSDASGAGPASVPAPGQERATIGGQQGTIYRGEGKSVRDLTPEELKQRGYPKDAHVQQDRDGRIHVLRKGGEGDGGPFGGNGLTAQDSNILVNGDPASREYALAYMRATETKFVPVQDPNDPTRTVMTAITPKLPPSIRPPAHLAQGAATPQPKAAPGVTDTAPNPLQTTDAAPESKFTVTPIPGTGGGGKPSNEQNLNAGFANRLNSSNNSLDELDAQGYDAPSLKDRVLDKVPGVNGYLTSDRFQQLEQAQRDFITAQLRRESGAAISQSEFEEAKKLYFPQPGEGPDIVARKRATREMAIRNMAQSSGPATLEFKPKPAPKEGDKPAKPTTIIKFDAEGNIVQ